MKEACVMNIPPSKTDLGYRAFTLADIAAAHGLSKALGSPYRSEDWQFSVEMATGFVAEENGVVIGTALYWTFGADRASLGQIVGTVHARLSMQASMPLSSTCIRLFVRSH